MNGWLIAGELENTSPGQWLVYAAILLTVGCALFRTVGNLSEIRRLRRFGLRRAGYYAIRVWGASSGRVQILLAAECLIVNVFAALLLLVLNDTTLW